MEEKSYQITRGYHEEYEEITPLSGKKKRRLKRKKQRNKTKR